MYGDVVTLGGTALNNACPPGILPKLVEEAVDEALRIGFEFCVHPSTGRLLSVLASGVPTGGLIGETGTGTGAGLAWMVSANPRARFVSVEKDDARVAAARRVFAQHPNVEIIHGDAGELFDRGPFDLLVHDGGWGSGKADPRRIDPTIVLKPNAVMTIDDYEPMIEWPPMFEGGKARYRSHRLALRPTIRRHRNHRRRPHGGTCMSKTSACSMIGYLSPPRP